MAAIRIKKPETVLCNQVRGMAEPIFIFALFSDMRRIIVLQSTKFLGKYRPVNMFLCLFSLVELIEKWNELHATTDYPTFRSIYLNSLIISNKST
jgi:hypothetical protein